VESVLRKINKQGISKKEKTKNKKQNTCSKGRFKKYETKNCRMMLFYMQEKKLHFKKCVRASPAVLSM
jgi:hypothetical protein